MNPEKDNVHTKKRRAANQPEPTQSIAGIESQMQDDNENETQSGDDDNSSPAVVSVASTNDEPSTNRQQLQRQGYPNLNGGTIVFETSKTAPHNSESLEFEVTLDSLSSAEYRYSFWVIVGGGGGHALTIRDLCLKRALVYDDNHRSLTKQHAALKKAGMYQTDQNPSRNLCIDLLLKASKVAHAYHKETTAKRNADEAFGENAAKGSTQCCDTMADAARALVDTLEGAGFGNFTDEEDIERLEVLGSGIQQAIASTPIPQNDNEDMGLEGEPATNGIVQGEGFFGAARLLPQEGERDRIMRLLNL